LTRIRIALDSNAWPFVHHRRFINSRTRFGHDHQGRLKEFDY